MSLLAILWIIVLAGLKVASWLVPTVLAALLVHCWSEARLERARRAGR